MTDSCRRIRFVFLLYLLLPACAMVILNRPRAAVLPRSCAPSVTRSFGYLPTARRTQSTSLSALSTEPDDVSAVATNSSQVMTVSGLGALFSFGLIYSLAMDSRDMAPAGDQAVIENFEALTGNVIDAMLPLTATDFISVSVGEALAGIVGAVASFFLSAILSQNRRMRNSNVGKNVVADGDFFLASAAALPLIQALGVSPAVSSLVTAIFATIPYELVKIGSRRRRQRIEEDDILQQLLEKEEKKKKGKSKVDSFSRSLFGVSPKTQVVVADPVELVPLGKVEDKLDFIEIFSDLLRWLGYGVLMNDFGGALSSTPGFESAVYGTVATISSQLYADILYSVFGLGGEGKREKVQSRSKSDWASIYFSQALYAATLFGVYDAAQIPAKKALNSLFSGVTEGCLGSVDYNMCAETFIFYNPPPSPTMDAQARALFTLAYSLWSRLGLDSVDLPSM